MPINANNPRKSVQRSRISVAPYRQPTKPVNSKNSSSLHNNNNSGSLFTSPRSNRINRKQNQVLRKPWYPTNKIGIQSDLKESSKKKRCNCGIWWILSCAIVGVILSGTIIGIVLIFELPYSATSSTSTTTGISMTATTASTAVVASTAPVTASTTAICSTTNVSSTTASPNTTTIFTVFSPCSSVSTYFPVVYYYIAKGSNETITFGIQNNPATTYISDVSVVSNGVELLCNGNFQNGTQICWEGPNHLQSGCGINGSYCYGDPIVGSLDYLSQSFSTTPGALLNISFWTRWTGSGTGVITIVTISP